MFLIVGLICKGSRTYKKWNHKKILNSEENSKRKVPNKMAKLNDKTHQTHGQQMSYSWLGTGIFKCRKWWVWTWYLSLVWQSHQIPLHLQRWNEQNRHNRQTTQNMGTAVITVSQPKQKNKYLTKTLKEHQNRIHIPTLKLVFNLIGL